MNICSDIHYNNAGLLGDDAVAALAETFRVLGDATRVRILDAISRTELCVGDIAGLLGLSESAVSHQLRVLRGMRLVRPRRAGQQIFYALDDHHIVGLFEQGLRHVQERGTAAFPLRERAATAQLEPAPAPSVSGQGESVPASGPGVAVSRERA
jgi:DNA-binding transcriptional ArsR family regulator